MADLRFIEIPLSDLTPGVWANIDGFFRHRFRRWKTPERATHVAYVTRAESRPWAMQAAAFLAHDVRRKGSLHIEYIASRGNGAGRALVRLLCQTGARTITAEVREDNVAVKGIFEDLGFIFTKRLNADRTWWGTFRP